MDCEDLYNQEAETRERLFHMLHAELYTVGSIGLLIGLGLLFKVWDAENKLQFENGIIALGFVQSLTYLILATMWTFSNYDIIGLKTWKITAGICFFFWVVGGLADYFIAFKYLKSAVGVAVKKASRLKKAQIIEWVLLVTVGVGFIPYAILIARYIVSQESQYSIRYMVANEIYVPEWILKLQIFSLFIIIGFSAILIIVLLRALYVIKSSNPNANVAFIVVHIVMFTCVYGLVCFSVFNIYSLSKAKTCTDLL